MKEINDLNKILDKKGKEISFKEKALKEREDFLNEKEKNFKNILKGECDVMLFTLEEACREKNNEINKKILTLDKQLKNKLKIIETKAKELK